jgi:nitrogen fixation protein NifU and related proteins
MTRHDSDSSEGSASSSRSSERRTDSRDDASRRQEFQTLILDHAGNPINFGELADAHRVGVGANPICGDRYRVFLRLSADRIETVRFTGSGCAISMASASIMTQITDGLRVPDAGVLADDVMKFFTSRSVDFDDEWGDLVALAGVRNFPLRIKCATLPWHALQAAILDVPDTVSTE